MNNLDFVPGLPAFKRQLAAWFCTFGLMAGTLVCTAAAASDISLQLQGEIQPGLYGAVQIGQPVRRVDQHPPVRAVIVRPVWVQAPKKHRQHWHKYCHHYRLCGQSVQFVEAGNHTNAHHPHSSGVVVYQQHDYLTAEHRGYRQDDPPQRRSGHRKHQQKSDHRRHHGHHQHDD